MLYKKSRRSLHRRWLLKKGPRSKSRLCRPAGGRGKSKSLGLGPHSICCLIGASARSSDDSIFSLTLSASSSSSRLTRRSASSRWTRVKTEWKYLYRAVDSHGQATDKHASHPGAFASSVKGKVLPVDCKLRWVKGLDNVIGQGHRATRRRWRAMQCFRSFHAAERTIGGVESLHMMGTGEEAGRKRCNRTGKVCREPVRGSRIEPEHLTDSFASNQSLQQNPATQPCFMPRRCP